MMSRQVENGKTSGAERTNRKRENKGVMKNGCKKWEYKGVKENERQKTGK